MYEFWYDHVKYETQHSELSIRQTITYKKKSKNNEINE